ncbi:hypothetical protein T4D_15183 [Trichinella pseudospiralis]|uniref:Uncharacterized protein n=1 Tax=Trichinella pseudospiralis TaxID=6337 RepID=A0A0V1FY34_TRIPS|nr:hypothetical protein T4D_15183 [Trichinella pseudospiralis]
MVAHLIWILANILINVFNICLKPSQSFKTTRNLDYKSGGMIVIDQIALCWTDNCNVTCVNKTALMDIKDNCRVKVFHMSLKRLLGFAKVGHDVIDFEHLF